MIRFVALGLWTALCLAQTPAADGGSPPPGVDEALRARISQFYQFHVDGKFRQAEALVAEDSKDFFYAANKPKYFSFEISTINYSDNFTKAKAVVLCEQYLLVLGFTDKPMKAPIRSTWKLVDGQWFYYVDPALLGMTVVGLQSPNANNPGKGAPAGLPAGMPTADQINRMIQQVNNLVKVDKEVVNLKAGESTQVTITNSTAGLMSILLMGTIEGVDVKLDHMELKAMGSAVLSLRAKAGAKSGSLTIQVEQTNQVIPIQVNIVPAQ